MKIKLLICCLLLSGITFAQVPSYYNDVNLSQSGTVLKDNLSVKITSTHTTFLSYTPGVWEALKQADLDPNNSNNVLLIYGYSDTDNTFKTDRTRSKDSNGGNIGLWNREHSYPKSLGLPNLGTTGPGSDAHHLRASDVQMNADRGNRKYADGSGNATITAQGYFYPGDEWKGDVARMMLFMYLRYGDRCLPKNVGVGTAISGDANMINLFLDWNVEDPVNAFEDQRNQVIAGIQGNRNPFIDNPAFATQIWGGPQAENRFGTGTDGGTSTASELFISEYVEGSSNNKAIEIANFTGNSVNLSAYSLRKQTNGSGGWSSGYALIGSVSNGNVFVVANSYASTALKNNAEAITTNAALTFNGNDPVGLFKNGVLIDIIGTFNGGSSNFAINTTLRRKPSVVAPTPNYTISQWTPYNQDTFSNVGSHTVATGSTTPSLTYCSTKGNSVADEYIDFVSIGGFSNSSGANGGYKDNTNLVGNVNYGSNTIVFSTGFSGQAYTEFWKVWIDFDKNGSFESSEAVVSGSSSSANNLSASFTIPSSAQSGRTRMRVSMKYNATPSPCETFSYGEVEDYTLNIGASSKVLEVIKGDLELEDEAPLYEVSLLDQFNGLAVKLKDKRVVNYSIYSVAGRLVAKGVFSQNLKLSTLESGLYIILIHDGQRTIQKKFLKR
ncbi:endonuclease [Lacinutrix sp. Hel_I_90]|uniref:endonuclease n=1 Tax=Lacinutrix sp. Hel_I_90 TaxID=1249999 RepID=UPI000698A01F|nr:endonuclease [Lacinutrix sp. Hel_I_90]